ncbi:MAG: hypothetical protein ACJA13_003305 [Paraglaciecola sp.]|jgi:hypothetical protein
MKKTRIAVVLSCSILTIPAAYCAQYRVIELPVSELGEGSYPTDINNVGEIPVNVFSQYSPVIDVNLIDFDADAIASYLSNIESAKVGDFNTYDHQILYDYIVANTDNQFFQQIATLNSYLATESYSSLIHGFDTLDPITNEYRNSATTTVRGINEFGYTVGLSYDGFYTLTYMTEDVVELTYVLNDFYSRGFAQIDGKVLALPPPETTAGGFSDAYDINAVNQVVGIGTTELVSDTLQTSVEACADADERGDVPEVSCLRSLSISANASIGTVFQRRGIIWQVDEQGSITDTLILPMLITPDSSDSNVYSSSAVAINDYGVAVGESPDFYQDSTSLTIAAAFYVDDTVTTINQDEDVFSSTAIDINNNNLVTGYVTKSVNGVTRNKFFVHDMDANLTEYPGDFFVGSSSVPTSINNQNMIVGYGEYESTTSGVRRTEGFVYDYRNDIFSGLNSLIECNSPYTIAQANGINDNNEIIATATVTRSSRDISGEIIVDELGAETETTQVVAVKLVPISGGSIDNCEVYEEDVPERQGASVSWLLLFGLLGFGRFKRQEKY